VDIELQVCHRMNPRAYLIPPPLEGTLASGQRANQSQLFLSAQSRAGGSWIRETPFDLGTGTGRVKGTEVGFPGSWPSPEQDPLNVAHHFSNWLLAVCRWGRRLQASPSMTMDFALDHIFSGGATETLRQRTQALRWEDPASVETLYNIVLEMGTGIGCVATYECALDAYLSLRIRDEESIVDFYVRLLNNLSLMVNSPHAPPQVDIPQLKARFVSGIAQRPVAHTHLTLTMDFDPRAQHHLYEPWDLVWANYQITVSPPQVAAVRAAPHSAPSQMVSAYEVVDPSTPGQGRGRKRPRGTSPKGAGPRNQDGRPILTGANANPLGTPPAERSSKSTQRFPLDQGVKPFAKLEPDSLKDRLRQLRRACIAPAVRDLPMARLKETAEVANLYSHFLDEIAQHGLPDKFCWHCHYWGHSTESSVCPKGSN